MVNLFGLFGRLGKHNAAGPDRDKPAREARYVVVDTELTGLDDRKDSIISIGAVRMYGGRIIAGETFYMLVDPEVSGFTRESVAIHGITPSDVGDKPLIDEAVYDLYRFIGKDIVVGHCLSIDLTFINRELKRIIGRPLGNASADTYRAHQWLLTRDAGYREMVGRTDGGTLYEIAGMMGISTGGAHNAEMDAFITAQVFQRYIPMLAAHGVATVGELIRTADPYKGGEIPGKTGDFNNF